MGEYNDGVGANNGNIFVVLFAEITKSRNHEKRKCGKAITIVLGWQKPLFGGCKMQHGH